MPRLQDLYHFDHFLGMFGNKLNGLINLQSYAILGSSADPGQGSVTVNVEVTLDALGNPGDMFRFVLVQREFGTKQGSWLTKSLVKLEGSSSKR